MAFLLNLRFSDADIAVDRYMIRLANKVQTNEGFVLTWYHFAGTSNFNAALTHPASVFE